MVHELKILPKFYAAVVSGEKRFELRYNDRDFKVGDELHLCEWADGKYTGRATMVKVTFIYNVSLGLDREYCIMSIR